MEKRFDVIVVGAGNGGLVTGHVVKHTMSIAKNAVKKTK